MIPRSDKKIGSLVRDTFLFGISNFGSKILLFLLTPLYTSVLLTEEYGIADLISTTVNFAYPILTLAIADATLRFALDKKESKQEILWCSLLFTGISILILFCLYPFSKFLDKSLSEYWIYFVITYCMFNIHNCFSNFLKGIEKTKIFAIQGIIQTITIIICNIIFLLAIKIGLAGYLISIILGYAIPIIFMFFVGGIYKYLFPIKLNKAIIKRMLKYSIPMIPTLLAWAVNTSIDKYMITGIIGLSENGLYSAAHKIPTLLTTVLSVFLQAWQISAITNHGSNDENEYYTKIYSGLNVICLLGSVVIILITKPLSSLLFAENYYSAWEFIPLLTISAVFSSLAGFLAAANRAAKKTTGLFYSVFVGAVINIIMNGILLKTIGTVGAAVATAISFLAVWLVRFCISSKNSKNQN